eukprot:5847579-Alexandrium_andersonii.AAC.1
MCLVNVRPWDLLVLFAWQRNRGGHMGNCRIVWPHSSGSIAAHDILKVTAFVRSAAITSGPCSKWRTLPR